MKSRLMRFFRFAESRLSSDSAGLLTTLCRPPINLLTYWQRLAHFWRLSFGRSPGFSAVSAMYPVPVLAETTLGNRPRASRWSCWLPPDVSVVGCWRWHEGQSLQAEINQAPPSYRPHHVTTVLSMTSRDRVTSRMSHKSRFLVIA